MNLYKALSLTPKAKAQWKNLTPIAQRDFLTWIGSAKQLETRKRRVEKACDMLAKGKRRPCCYAMVPMNLYKALGVHTKAQTQWKGLTSSERRDFVDWIESAKQPEIHKSRIEKACAMLASGRRHP